MIFNEKYAKKPQKSAIFMDFLTKITADILNLIMQTYNQPYFQGSEKGVFTKKHAKNEKFTKNHTKLIIQ